jgi:hypothetical protein
LKTTFIIIWILALLSNSSFAQTDTTQTSTQAEAITYIDGITSLKASEFWPAIKPSEFLENVKRNIYSPLDIYEGYNTNFCGYAALSYLPLHDDPLGYAKNMIQLYEEGKVKWGKAILEPSAAVRKAAGTFHFKGVLDVRPADQLWYLSLADHFKGYLNFFNKRYNPGDENTFWASVNYAKFNRMVRKLFNYQVDARGLDLFHPSITNLYDYIKEQMKTGTTVLYINNAYVYKKKHNSLRPGIPTHYIIILDMQRVNDVITITYWDYGFRSLRQFSPSFLRKVVFGISHCTKKNAK